MFARNMFVRIFSVLSILACILAVAPIKAAGAPATIRYATPNGLTSGTCSTWATVCTLQTALTGAAANSEIWVAAGTYKPTTGSDRSTTFQLKDGVAVYGGFAGTETVRTQRHPGTHVTILSGDIGTGGVKTDNSFHVVTGATGAILDGFTITLGYASNTTPPNCYGGGIYNYASSPTLTNLTVSNNWAYQGGGIYNDNRSSPGLTNVTISGNTASSLGGGMMNTGFSNPTLTNVTFSANSANDGGGMLNWFASPILTNTTFSGNAASETGGAIHNWSESYPQVHNSILWGNTAVTSGAEIHSEDATTTVSYSVVQGGCSAADICTSQLITTDPKLGTLGNHGGYTQTIPIGAGSSAINKGDTSVCPATDQRGEARVGVCDIGAYEYKASTNSLYLPLLVR